MIAAFGGWNDAAAAASSAVVYIGEQFGARRVASMDPEEFYDFQATRPLIDLTSSETSSIMWPEVELLVARPPDGPHDLLLVAGAEPSMRWQTFSRALLDAAETAQGEARGAAGVACSPTWSTATRCASRACPPTPRSSAASASATPATPAPRASSACCTTTPWSAAWRRCPSGRRSPTTPPGSPTPRAAWRWCAPSTPSPASAWTWASWRRPPPPSRARWPGRSRPSRACASWWSSWRTPPGRAEEEPTDDGPLPTGDELAAELERFLRERDEPS